MGGKKERFPERRKKWKERKEEREERIEGKMKTGIIEECWKLEKKEGKTEE